MKRLLHSSLPSIAALALFLAGPAWAVNNPTRIEAGTTAGHVTVAGDCAAGDIAVAAILTTSAVNADTPTDSGGNTWHALATSATNNQGAKLWTYYSILTSPLTVAGASWVQGTVNGGSAAHNSFVCVNDARALGTATGAANASTSTSSPTTGAPNGPITISAQPEWIMVAEMVQTGVNTATLTGLTAVPNSGSAASGFGILWHHFRQTTNGSYTYSTGSTYTSWVTDWGSFTEVSGGSGGSTTNACPNQLLLGEC